MTNNGEGSVVGGFLPITLYVSVGSQCNSEQTNFPGIRECHSIYDFLHATIYDYTNIRFQNGRRKSDNFVEADCLVGDVDNTHSDNPNDWVEPCDVAERLHGVPLFAQYSRNHLKVKNGKSARPKFHFVVPIQHVNNTTDYNLQWRLLKAVVPEIDPATKDCARFTFGGGKANKGEAFEGSLTLTEYCEINEIEPVSEESRSICLDGFTRNSSKSSTSDGDEFEDGFIIYDGERNRKLLSFANRYYYRYRGDTNRDNLVWNNLLCLAQDHCSPPLSSQELQNIFKSAKRYAERERQKAFLLLNSINAND